MTAEAAAPGQSGADETGLKELNRIVSALQAGKLSERADAAGFTGEWAQAFEAINCFAGEMNGLISDMNAMSAAHGKGDIDAVIDAPKYPGDFGRMAAGINSMVAGHIAVKKKAMACVDEIAKGNFEAPLERFPGKKAFINDTVETLRANLKGIIASMNAMSDAHEKGDIDAVIEASRHPGDFGRVATGINNMVAGHIAVKKKAMACVDEIAKGNFEAPLERFPGKKAFINETVERLRTNLKAVSGELNRLTQASRAGQLDERGKAAQFQGDFAGIVNGINAMLDAILLPIAEGNRVLRLIRGGNLREKVEIECHGDHQRMKEAINGVHQWLTALVAYVTGIANGDLTVQMDKASDQDQIHEWLMLLKSNIAALVTDANMLAKAAVEGKLNTRADASKHQGDYRKIIDGVNRTIGTLVGHFDAVPAPIMIIDRDFNVQYMNTAGAKAGGRSAQQVIGGKCYDHFKTGDCGTENCACRRAMTRNQPANAETVAKPMAGVEMDISYTGVPIHDEEGNIAGALEVVVDQTDVKKAARLAKKVADYQAVETEKLVDGLGRLAKGDADFTVETTAGDADTAGVRQTFETLAGALNTCVDAVNRLVTDANMLSAAAVEGKLATRADASKHQGEFRKIVQGVNDTLDAVITPLNNIKEVIGAMGQNDMSVSLKGEYRGDFLALREAFERALAEVNGTLHQIVDAVEQVGQSAEQLNAASQNLASNSEEQSSSVEEVTSSIEETDSQVKANTDAANTANQLVMSTSQAANAGQAKMGAMTSAMNEINASAQNIAKIIKVIDEIAFQTNLLALNAAVEAARAGQHGRGFAVVAQEVRNLAGRSAKAARETAELIENSVKQVANGVGIAKETSEALDQIVGNVVKVKDLVGEIASASAEQTRGVSQINVAMNQAAKAAQEGSQQSEELAASSSELSRLAECMRDSVRRFKLRERAHAAQVIAGLEALTPEMLVQLQAMIAAQKRASAAPAARQGQASAGRRAANAGVNGRTPKAIIPLDRDERGFGEF